MTVTATAAETLKSVLDEANPNRLADALRKVALGTLLTPAKLTLTGLTGTTHNITDAAHGSNPAILSVVSLRATAATTAASVGSYAVTDAGGTVLSPTASSKVGFAKLSDDGATLTFATGDVTAFVLEYIPRSANDITAAFARS
jgi:hypothetical protein